MTIVLYDLVGADDRRFSTNCWRTQFALAHKGLDYETRPTCFTEIKDVAGGGYATIPVIEDGATIVHDSWTIAEYLEDTYPDRPSLFGGPAGRGPARLTQIWSQTQIATLLLTFVVGDLHDRLLPHDQAYFRQSREKRLGATIEDVMATRDERVKELRARFEPLRAAITERPFLGGETPTYADYLAAGPLLWRRAMSPYRILADDDPVQAWFERILDLYDGLLRASPGYD